MVMEGAPRKRNQKKKKAREKQKKAPVQKMPSGGKKLVMKKKMFCFFFFFSLTVILIIVIASSSSPGTESKPSLDGEISAGEWNMKKQEKIPFWLDVDNRIGENSTVNLDAWNYIYAGLGEKDLYLGLDLCSERKNQSSSEIDLFISTVMPSFYNSSFAMHSLRDNGAEWMMYDNGLKKERTPGISFGSSCWVDGIPYNNLTDSIFLEKGNTSSNFSDYMVFDSKNYTIKSVESRTPQSNFGMNAMGDLVAVHFSINLTSKFPAGYTGTFLNNTSSLKLNFQLSGNVSGSGATQAWKNSTPGLIASMVIFHKLNMSCNDSQFFSSGGENVVFNANETASISITVLSNFINKTTGMVYFSIFCYNEINRTANKGFEIYIDKMDISISTVSYNGYCGTTINALNYEIFSAFDSSPDCEEKHRMYEIRLSLSEFPEMDGNKLYLFVIVRGSLHFDDLDYWCFPQHVYGFKENPFPGFPVHSGTFFPVVWKTI